jgi:PKD repeat protein
MNGGLITLYEVSDANNHFIKSLSNHIKPLIRQLPVYKLNVNTHTFTIVFSVLILWLLGNPGYANVNKSGKNDKSSNGIADPSNNGNNKDKEYNFDFIAFPTSGNAPLTVVFQPRINFNFDKIEWNFGDFLPSNGGISTESIPVYVYKHPGIYTVSLSVTINGTTLNKMKNEYIRVEDDNKNSGTNKNPLQQPIPDIPNKNDKILNADDQIDPFNSKPVSVKIESDLSDRIKKEIEMISNNGEDHQKPDKNYTSNYISALHRHKNTFMENLHENDRRFLIEYYDSLISLTR